MPRFESPTQTSVTLLFVNEGRKRTSWSSTVHKIQHVIAERLGSGPKPAYVSREGQPILQSSFDGVKSGRGDGFTT
jgi:hypothetical protein